MHYRIVAELRMRAVKVGIATLEVQSVFGNCMYRGCGRQAFWGEHQS
jgi:hypothetical protein